MLICIVNINLLKIAKFKFYCIICFLYNIFGILKINTHVENYINHPPIWYSKYLIFSV